jgi:hypothetical protein
LPNACRGLQCVWNWLRRGAVLRVRGGGLLDVRCRVVLAGAVHALLLLRRRLVRVLAGGGCRGRDVQLSVWRATQRGRPPGGFEAGLGCGRGRVSARRVGLLLDGRLQALRGLEGVGTCARLSSGRYAQIAHGRAYAAQCRRGLVDAGGRVVLRILVVVAERHGVAPGGQLRPRSACKEAGWRVLGRVIVYRVVRAEVEVSSSKRLYLVSTPPPHSTAPPCACPQAAT